MIPVQTSSIYKNFQHPGIIQPSGNRTFWKYRFITRTVSRFSLPEIASQCQFQPTESQNIINISFADENSTRSFSEIIPLISGKQPVESKRRFPAPN
jgi:hypothetical protein